MLSSHTPRRCIPIISCTQSRKLELSGCRKKTRQAEPRLRANPLCEGSAARPHTLGVPRGGQPERRGAPGLPVTSRPLPGGKAGLEQPPQGRGARNPPRPPAASTGATNPSSTKGGNPGEGTEKPLNLTATHGGQAQRPINPSVPPGRGARTPPGWPQQPLTPPHPTERIPGGPGVPAGPPNSTGRGTGDPSNHPPLTGTAPGLRPPRPTTPHLPRRRRRKRKPPVVPGGAGASLGGAGPHRRGGVTLEGRDQTGGAGSH